MDLVRVCEHGHAQGGRTNDSRREHSVCCEGLPTTETGTGGGAVAAKG